MDSIDGSARLLEEAAVGRLPEWAETTRARREHMRRVAALMADWAERLGLSASERERWNAAAWLHDALRDADPEALRPLLSADERKLPPSVLHGPAVAARLVGGLDGELLDALRYHTVGHPGLGRLGRALYLADFLEPGRNFSNEWRAELRARMPFEMTEVLAAVIRARITHLLDERKPIRPETAAFWSRVAEELRE